MPCQQSPRPAPLEAQAAGQGGGAASASLNEAVAATGLRTQTIQLLRDGLYRACEAYLNGAIDEFGHALLLNKYDETMVSLVSDRRPDRHASGGPGGDRRRNLG